MNIRLAGCQDAQTIVNLIHELARVEGEASPLTAAYTLEYLAHPGSVVLLAEEGKEILGLLGYSTRPDLYHAGVCAEIETLVVSEKSRGQGVGQALVQYVMQLGRQQGWAEISVSTLFENTPAIEFYRKNGFEDEAILLEKHFH